MFTTHISVKFANSDTSRVLKMSEKKDKQKQTVAKKKTVKQVVKSKANELKLKPSEIRYTQCSISNKFQDVSGTIGNLLDDIVIGRCFASAIKPIEVVKHNKLWFSNDNRRLWVFKQLESLGKLSEITVKVVTKTVPGRLTTQNGGTSIVIRGGNPGGIMHEYLKRNFQTSKSECKSSGTNPPSETNRKEGSENKQSTTMKQQNGLDKKSTNEDEEKNIGKTQTPQSKSKQKIPKSTDAIKGKFNASNTCKETQGPTNKKEGTESQQSATKKKTQPASKKKSTSVSKETNMNITPTPKTKGKQKLQKSTDAGKEKCIPSTTEPPNPTDSKEEEGESKQPQAKKKRKRSKKKTTENAKEETIDKAPTPKPITNRNIPKSTKSNDQTAINKYNSKDSVGCTGGQHVDTTIDPPTETCVSPCGHIHAGPETPVGASDVLESFLTIEEMATLLSQAYGCDLEDIMYESTDSYENPNSSYDEIDTASSDEEPGESMTEDSTRDLRPLPSAAADNTSRNSAPVSSDNIFANGAERFPSMILEEGAALEDESSTDELVASMRQFEYKFYPLHTIIQSDANATRSLSFPESDPRPYSSTNKTPYISEVDVILQMAADRVFDQESVPAKSSNDPIDASEGSFSNDRYVHDRHVAHRFKTTPLTDCYNDGTISPSVSRQNAFELPVSSHSANTELQSRNTQSTFNQWPDAGLSWTQFKEKHVQHDFSQRNASAFVSPDDEYGQTKDDLGAKQSYWQTCQKAVDFVCTVFRGFIDH